MVQHRSSQRRAGHDPDRLRPDDLTPRGWLVGCVVATVALALLTAGIGALVPGPAPEGDGAPVRRAPSVTAGPTVEDTPSPSSDRPDPSGSHTRRPRGEWTPKVPQHGPGTYRRATVRLPNDDPRGRVVRYAVRVEDGVEVDPDEAARIIHGVLGDERSWSGDGSVTWLLRPKGKVDLTVSISTPDTTDRLCRPLDTRGEVSCRNQDVIALNAVRWTRGVPHFDGDLMGYRQYLVNHEFGHYLGHGHRECPGPGKKAPVMMTQTISLGRCTKNPWPADDP